jgi:hypothetical protein
VTAQLNDNAFVDVPAPVVSLRRLGELWVRVNLNLRLCLRVSL